MFLITKIRNTLYFIFYSNLVIYFCCLIQEYLSFYFDYKKFLSIILMVVVNAKYEFIVVDAGVNGRVSDGGIISVTEFGRRTYLSLSFITEEAYGMFSSGTTPLLSHKIF